MRPHSMASNGSRTHSTDSVAGAVHRQQSGSTSKLDHGDVSFDVVVVDNVVEVGSIVGRVGADPKLEWPGRSSLHARETRLASQRFWPLLRFGLIR